MVLTRLAFAIGACVALAATTQTAFAQQWPNRTVKVVVPYGVGGVTDTMARLTADRLGKALGQTFVIENKLGAGGAIGVDYALNSRRMATQSFFSAARCSPFSRWRRK
jgi:tripartite-type tricarboxylate transporter receptor subunit TctC